MGTPDSEKRVGDRNKDALGIFTAATEMLGPSGCNGKIGNYYRSV